jgi:hypothetical protein
LQLRDRRTRKRIQPDQEDGLLEKRLYSERPPREEYDLAEAGYDYLPVLFLIAARGRKHRGKGKLTRFLDADTGKDIKPEAIDAVTGAELGTRAIRVRTPERRSAIPSVDLSARLQRIPRSLVPSAGYVGSPAFEVSTGFCAKLPADLVAASCDHR